MDWADKIADNVLNGTSSDEPDLAKRIAHEIRWERERCWKIAQECFPETPAADRIYPAHLRDNRPA